MCGVISAFLQTERVFITSVVHDILWKIDSYTVLKEWGVLGFGKEETITMGSSSSTDFNSWWIQDGWFYST